MVRKTKEDAEKTRQNIIDAARAVFLHRGVSKTSLEQIALEAGVTRGAVYWHFQNKTELLVALRERVLLPLIDHIEDVLIPASNSDALAAIETFLCSRIEVLDECSETRETYEIMMTKCEYVDDFADVMQEMMSSCSIILDNLVRSYRQAQQQGMVSKNLDANELAMDTHLFFVGLLHMWVKDISGKNIRHQAISAIKAHINLHRK